MRKHGKETILFRYSSRYMAEKLSKSYRMKKYWFILSSLVLLALGSCNKFLLSDIIETNEYSIEGTYTELQVENAFDVTVSDTATKITVYADQNVMPYVIVEKVGDKLKIHLKSFNFNIGMVLNEVVLPYNPDLKKVNLSGDSEFHSAYGLEGDEVEVKLSGASDFYCDIDAEEVEIDLSGASTINGNLTATELDLDLSGASNATLTGQVTTLDIELSGASNAYLHCDGSIKVSLSGASDLHYTGDASTTGSNTSGGSDLIHDKL